MLPASFPRMIASNNNIFFSSSTRRERERERERESYEYRRNSIIYNQGFWKCISENIRCHKRDILVRHVQIVSISALHGNEICICHDILKDIVLKKYYILLIIFCCTSKKCFWLLTYRDFIVGWRFGFGDRANDCTVTTLQHS